MGRWGYIKLAVLFSMSLSSAASLPSLNALAQGHVTPWPASVTGAADGEGRAAIIPSETTVGRYLDYRIVFQLGPSGIAEGGSIRIDLPTATTFHGLHQIVNWSKPQKDDPFGDGFVTVYPTDKLDIDIITFKHSKSGNLSYGIKIVASQELLPLKAIIVLYTHSRAQWIPQVAYFPIYTDADGDGLSKRISKVPAIRVMGGSAQGIRATIPSILGVGEEFDLKVAILDGLGFRASSYAGSITFESTGTLHNLPDSYTFSEQDHSVHVFPGVSFQTPGIFTVTVKDGPMSGVSNPCLVVASGPSFKLYWGDIHWHSQASDGLRSPREGYIYARDISGLDFTAMTDHDGFLDRRNLWNDVRSISNSFNDPGRFVTFVAYEWTGLSAMEGGPGHKNVYYAGDNGPLFSILDPLTATPDGLWNHLEGLDAITIPHHVARSAAATDWSYRHDDLQPLVEIYSNHGNGEFHGAPPPFHEGAIGHYVQDALEMGHRLGNVASSDSHYTLPGGNESLSRLVARQGLPALVAVYAPAITRRHLFDQMKRRRTYATTGRRVILWFVANSSHLMGDEFTTAYPPELYVGAAAGGLGIDKVEIIRDNTTIHTKQPASPLCEISFTDSDFASFSPGTTHYYYVRVTLEDTFSLGEVEYSHLAWSSPIWITKD